MKKFVAFGLLVMLIVSIGACKQKEKCPAYGKKTEKHNHS